VNCDVSERACVEAYLRTDDVSSEDDVVFTSLFVAGKHNLLGTGLFTNVTTISITIA
jgi:hypothetical protein